MEIIGMPRRFSSKTMENFNSTGQEEQIRDADIFVQLGKSIFLSGPTGSGKTHLATALLRNRVWHLEKVGSPWPSKAIFLPAVEFFVELKTSFNNQDNSESDILDKYERANILLIDDLGAEKISDWSRQMFYTLIDRHYRNEGQLIITSNLTLDRVAAQIDDRIASRLIEMGLVLEMNPVDYRMKGIPGQVNPKQEVATCQERTPGSQQGEML